MTVPLDLPPRPQRTGPLPPDGPAAAMRTGRRRRARTRTVAAAASVAALGLAAIGLVALPGSGPDSLRTADTPGATSGPTDAPTAAPDRSEPPPSPTATAAPPRAPAARPDAYVVSTRAALVVDSVSSPSPRTVATYEPTQNSGEQDLPERYLATIELTPDGTVAYADVCCEPAAGRVERIPLATGRTDDRAFLSGRDPAVSPDGSRLAAFALDMLVIATVGRNGELVPGGTNLRPTDSQSLASRSGLAWSPDGTLLAMSEGPDDGLPGPPAPSSVRLLTLRTASTLADGVVLDPPDGQTYAAPAFRGDGMLVVARQPAAPGLGTATGVVLDPASGRVVSEFPLDARVADQDYDRSGTYLLTTYENGSVAWQGAGLSGRLRQSGAVSAAW